MPRTILMIEDDPQIRDDLAELLRREGYEVQAAANGHDALQRLHSSEPLPDLILLDLIMPEVDGWQFRAAQVENPNLGRIPAFVVSGAGDVRQEGIILRAAGYLNKPFKFEFLLGVLRKVCSAARPYGLAA